MAAKSKIDVRQMKAMYAIGTPMSEIAESFGVARQTVYQRLVALGIHHPVDAAERAEERIGLREDRYGEYRKQFGRFRIEPSIAIELRNKGASNTEIAWVFRVSSTAVGNFFKKREQIQ